MQDKLSTHVAATLSVYISSGKKAFFDLGKNWLLILGAILAYQLFNLITPLFSGSGMAGGFIMGFFYLALLTLYYSWLRTVVNGDKLKLEEMLSFDFGLFSGLISAAFPLFIVKFIAEIWRYQPDTAWLYSCVVMGLFLIFNAIPEIVYLRGHESLLALKEAADFTKTHWIEWYLPLVLLLTPMLVLSWSLVLVTLTAADPILPPLVLVSQISLYIDLYLNSNNLLISLAGILTAIIVANWFMIFRAYLFQELETGNRRIRNFKQQMN